MFVYVLLNTLIAVFGPAALESLVHPLRLFNPYSFWPYSGVAILLAEWFTEIVSTALYGLVVAKVTLSKTAVWSWVIPTGLFLCRASVCRAQHRLGLLTGNTGFASHFSGHDCAIGLQRSECGDFWIFTFPLIRGLSYSATARLVLRRSVARQEV